MCTSLTYETSDKTHFLARTMDFGFELEGRPMAIPRNYSWTSKSHEHFTTRYGFIGTGRELESIFLADGINEHGLSIAELYHANTASYHQEPIPDKINLAPYELIMWVLGELKSVAELRTQIRTVNLLAVKLSLLDTVPPLHYIVMDSTGETVVLESENGELLIKENPVGVMTNAPDFEWHLTNLNNFLSLQPTNFATQQVGELILHPFGQGSGTYGLPGGYTSPERFVRTVYTKFQTKPAKNTIEGVNTILKILNGVTIPKGVNVKDDGADDYTQYRAILNATELTYYFNPYESNEIFAVKLTEDILNQLEPLEFLPQAEMQIQFLNE